MPIEVSVHQKKPVAPGQYKARISSIDEPKPSQFGGPKMSMQFMFEILDGEFEGVKLSKYVNAILSEKSLLGHIWMQLLGDLPEEETVDVEQLINSECEIVVTHKISGQKTVALIDQISGKAKVKQPNDTTRHQSQRLC